MQYLACDCVPPRISMENFMISEKCQKNSKKYLKAKALQNWDYCSRKVGLSKHITFNCGTRELEQVSELFDRSAN